MERSRTCIVVGGRRRLHSTLPDGSELVEEFDMNSHELLLRRIKKPADLGEGRWDIEVGEPVLGTADLVPSSVNPVFMRKDTTTEFQWRVRNLPYSADVFSVSGDASGKITIRTTNKKYYKVFTIPDLLRRSIPLQPSLITSEFQFNTLIVTYPKPHTILEEEAQLRARLQSCNRPGRVPKEGDIEWVD
mmetsp:Transcript_15908/g.29106  ORF Transcript_15908/g.29106 Transcript_15908/m.29106 type:complete len:189 (+) Transcript_15908:1398-1964(+)|eukprot:CAMPEP_0204897080 /NCGR_PEP_ID=MMETSP1397-20131031/537_1 /ASSEMBLY_ACC=CAM_ASM_000891 /TAXON_ID=49980 /ORGANISM="Climacostomum Climacostomum virens, Strain Stock W-24" /LENGTH=188 /DNA_ID=CAMNT_0052064783 /DNA_START=1387 /DNA_END=1953 /DNA_ORIENTATION=+